MPRRLAVPVDPNDHVNCRWQDTVAGHSVTAHKVTEAPEQLTAHIQSLKRANSYDVRRVVHLHEKVSSEQGETFLVYG